MIWSDMNIYFNKEIDWEFPCEMRPCLGLELDSSAR